MLTGEVKNILIDVIQKFVANHQEKRSQITLEDVKKFLSTHERKFKKQAWDMINKPFKSKFIIMPNKYNSISSNISN